MPVLDRRLLAAVAGSRRREGGDVPDAAQSTLTTAAFNQTADGATTNAYTGTVRDAAGNALPNVTVTVSVDVLALAGAATCTVEATSPIANDGVETSTVTVTVLDSDGNPMEGVPAANVVIASTGSNNTITQPSVATDADGRTTGLIKSTTAEAKTVSATVLGIAVTDTAALTVTGTPAAAWFEEAWDYTNTANMQSDPNNWFDADRQDQPGLSTITLDTGLTTPWGGTKALKLSFDDMSGSLPSGTEVELGKNIALPDAAADTPKEIWIEIYIKFDDVWTTNFEPGTFDHKTFFVLQKDTGGGRYRHDLRIGNSSDADPGTVLTYPGESSNYWLNTAANGSSVGRIGANTWFWDGEWHLVRWHMKISSDYQVTDAVKQMTVDGTLVADQSGFYTSGDPDGGSRPTENEYIAYLALGRNLSRPNQAQAFWFGRIRIYNTTPGWTF